MKQLTLREANKRLEAYFASRKIPRLGQDGTPLTDKNGIILYEERPCTVTGLALAMGFSCREELEGEHHPKIKALFQRALLQIEESAEEKLFSKDTYHGAKAFLTVNFKRWSEEERGGEEESVELGRCTLWSE